MPQTDPTDLARHEVEQRKEAAMRERQALAGWTEALPIRGTIAETYLRFRGITCDLPYTLRFHPECWHTSARRLPAKVALVEGRTRLAVHRTHLQADVSGKAEVKPAKAMLGTTTGGAVRLSDTQGALVVAEGMETALSLACGPLHGPATIWAALSTSGMAGLVLPSWPGHLVVATDGDPAGKAAGHKPAARADALGWKVSILPASEGRDWNDILSMKVGNA